MRPYFNKISVLRQFIRRSNVEKKSPPKRKVAERCSKKKQTVTPPPPKPAPPSTAQLCRNISLFAVIPALLLFAGYLFLTHDHIKRPPFIKYSYMYKRDHKFPWGDGNHTLFHNPRVNALPDGYETKDEDDDDE